MGEKIEVLTGFTLKEVVDKFNHIQSKDKVFKQVITSTETSEYYLIYSLKGGR